MSSIFRIGVAGVFIMMLAIAAVVRADDDLAVLAANAKQQFAVSLRQAETDAAAKNVDAHKALAAGIDAALKSVMAAGKLDDANQIAALRKSIDDADHPLPPAESILSADARKAIQAFEAARQATDAERAARQAAACREYIAALDGLVKRALHAENLDEANRINAMKQAADLELKVGLGRFPDNPVLLLTFDPGTVVTAGRPHIADQSGHGNDILLDGPVKFVPAPFGTAMRIPGDKPLHSTQLVGISGHQPRTLSFWLNIENIPGGELHSFLTWGAPGNGGEFGAMISRGHYTLWGWGSNFDFNTTAMVEPKTWHHHAIVYDGTTVTWYIDGKSIGSHRLNLDTVPAPLALGGMECLLTEVAIYDRVLSTGEINLLGHHGRMPVAPPDVVAEKTPEPIAANPNQAVAVKPSKTRNRPGKATNAPVVIAETPAPELPINGEFFSLAGQAGLPGYLKCEQQLVGGPTGMRWGTVRTTATDFLDKDFVCDIVFALTLGDPHRDAIIGIGDNDDRANPLVCHLTTDDLAGHAQMSGGRHETKRFADLKPDVPNLLRLEKKGDVLTISVTGDFKGKYRADFLTTIPSIKSAAPQLNRLNSNLCFSGNALFESIRLEVDGKVVDPGPVMAKFVEPPAAEGWMKLEPGSTLPPYLDGSSGVTIGKDGMEMGGKIIRTRKSDYLSKDFTLDVVYAFQPDERGELRIGIGENGYNGGNWILNSFTALMHGPADNGSVNYTFKDLYNEPHLGNLGKEHPGPNLVRFQKRGDTMLISVCADYTTQYQPDFLVIIPSLKWQAPHLNSNNSGLFIGGAGTIQRMRMMVDGKMVGDDAAVSVATAGHPANPPASSPPGASPAKQGKLFSLGGESGIPSFLHASPATLADARGLSDGEISTVATDLVDHDFIFDLVFAQEQANRDFHVFLGEKLDDDAIAIHTIGADGSFALKVPHQEWTHIGKTGMASGPHLLRIAKQGNTLTFSLYIDSSNPTAPDFVRTIPDLKSAAPKLTRLNSAIRASGDGSIRAAGLSIDGVDQDKQGTPAISAVPPSSATHIIGPETRPGTDAHLGAENFIKFTGPKLPGFFETQHDLKYTKDGLAMKDVHLRTRDADLIDKDFTFDIVFHFTGERETLMVGLGADEREGNWNHKSVVCRVESPPGGGYARIVMDNAPDTTIGSFGTDNGPHLLRLQKRGNTLTFVLCVDYKDKIKLDFLKTLPDLKSASPMLTAKNSRIFVGDGAVVEEARLFIEGESTESSDIALNIPARCLERATLHQKVISAANKTCTLDGPPIQGLTLTPAGILNWVPAHDQIGHHELKIKISGGGQTIVESADVEVVSLEDAQAVGGDLSKIDSLYRLALESNKTRITPGLGGASLLVLDGQTLRQTGPDGLTITHTWKLPGTYEFIGERKDYFVAMSNETKSLDIIDRKTMKITRSVQMDYFRRHDLCLNPAHPISYVSVDKASGAGGFIQAILVVDEASGDVREPDHFVGTFLKASPDGKRLYAGYKDIYTRGHELLFNPDNIDVVPVYGNIDILIIYDISRPAQPRTVAAKNEVGGNGQGLAVSPDGSRVAYLSHVGYPLYSDNISAWDPNDLTKRPVSYPTKANKADCKKLAFHPILPIAAAPAEGGAVCFDRESGQLQANRLDLRTPIGEVKTHDVIFSPDGRNLILTCEYQGDLFLRRVKLNLSDEESAKVKEGPPAPAPAIPAEDGSPPRLRT